MTGYSSTKAAVIGFTKSLGKEVATEGICVNAVAPAVVRTRILDQLTDAQIDYMTQRIPMRRTGKPEEIAAVVHFLASPDCSFVTGPVLRRQRRPGHVLMLCRRAICLGVAIAAALWPADPPSVDFVHLSDTHVANLKIAHPGLARELEAKKDAVPRFFKVLETLRRDVAPSFVLITGDLADAYGYESANGRIVYKQLDVFKSIFDRSPIPIYPVLGNHDLTQYRFAGG